jgi:hypothetical protein
MTAIRIKSILGAFVISLSTFLPIQSARAVSTYPTAPESLTATPAPASLVLNWLSPTDIASGITGYQAEYSTDGSSWTVASSSIAANGSSYTVTGLQVNTNYYVRVAAKVSAGLGPYAYPWTKLYGTNYAKRDGSSQIQYQSGYGIGGSDTGTILANASFTRVRYLTSANNSGSTVWADMNFAKWGSRTDTNPSYSAFTVPAATVPYLRIPSTPASEQFVIKTNVNDLTVNSSMSSLIGFGRFGRLEIWPYDYNTMSTSLTPANANSNFDWDDAPAMGSGYGCFQIFDLTDTHTVFAWNNHSNTPDVGFATQSGGHPDWTFAGNFSYGTHTFSVEIFANIPISTSQMGIGSVSVDALTGSVKKSTAKTITARTAGAGYVTFYANGRPINRCVNLATVGNVATCSWKPITQGQNTVTAKFTSSGYSSATSLNQTVTAGKR